MVRKVYLVCLFCQTPPPSPPTLTRKCLLVAALIPHSDLSTSRPGTQRQGWWVVGPLPSLWGTGGAAQGKLYKTPTHVKDRHVGARMDITCQEVFNSCFLGLSHQILSSRLGLPLKLQAVGRDPRDLTTGGHTVSPTGTCRPVGSPLGFLLTILLS